MPRMDAIGIISADLAESVAFYQALGVQFPDSWDPPHVEATLDSGVRLMLDSLEFVKEHDPNWQPPVGTRMGLAFLCDSPADVDATYAKMTGMGYTGTLEPWDAFWGQRYAQIQDPDGNGIDLFAPL